MQTKRIKPMVLYSMILLASILTIGICIGIGSTAIPLTGVYQIIIDAVFPFSLESEWTKSEELIVLQIRTPRVMLAFVVGAALSLAGAAFQGLLRNPLADPYTLGVSSGASLGAVISVYFHLTLPFLGIYSLPFIAIIGAFITLLMVYGISALGNRMMTETMILAGIIISAFIGAFISLIVALSGEQMMQIIYWLMGSVAMRDWGHVTLVLPFLLIAGFILLWKSRELNLMAFGDETAQFLGVDMVKSKKWILISASLLTGASVAVSGVVGFVGLVIPHLVRILIGPNHTHLLPISMVVGGIFLVIADTIARTIISPSELPLGVITALIGTPVFAILLMKRQVGIHSGRQI